MVARLLILLYAWAFPVLGLVHPEVGHQAQAQLCSGYAWEHRDAGPTGVPRILNLHIPLGESQCDVCALAGSIPLACRTAVGTLPPVRLPVRRPPSAVRSGARTCTGPLGS